MTGGLRIRWSECSNTTVCISVIYALQKLKELGDFGNLVISKNTL